MLPFDEAFQLCMKLAPDLPAEGVPIQSAFRRVLAADVYSDRAVPPFDKSAVDGYACRQSDIGKLLDLIEIVPAGTTPTQVVGPGQCTKIMTGAPVPVGADCVVMVEYSELSQPGRVAFTIPKSPANIARMGEELAAGAKVLEKGTWITERDLGVLATLGCDPVPVSKSPGVKIFSTGDELVEPWENPSPSQIRNSNALQLIAQIEKRGVQATYGGILADNEADFLEALSVTDQGPSVSIFSGSVSMGDFDLIPKTIRTLGYQIIFEKIAIQPGKPTLFAQKDQSFVFGLPGNPVSSFLLAELLVVPFILKMLGCQKSDPVIPLRLGAGINRKNSDREKWIPVSISREGVVFPVPFLGSAHLHALTKADGLIRMQRMEHTLNEGQLVHVRLL